MKIVYLPLDERPCNRTFPKQLFKNADIITFHDLGYKKLPSSFVKIEKFLSDACANADGLIISLDMLLYGGLIPSRIHHLSIEELKKRLLTLEILKQKYPKLLVYAFGCIMRCPDYDSDDEEPDYYATYGKAIHDYGVLVHQNRINGSCSDKISMAMKKIMPAYLEDYIQRRQVNCDMNLEMLEMVKKGIIDALVIPQDDSKRYGYAAMDQEFIRKAILKKGLEEKVMLYPGADEVGLTLFARMINTFQHVTPKVFVYYESENSKTIIPLYEGVTLSKTVDNHIVSSGCIQTYAYEYADIILILSAPSGNMMEAICQPAKTPEYLMERNFGTMISFIRHCKKEGKIITIGDNAYANGSDLSLISTLNNAKLLTGIHGYAGWNTNANTLGTALAMSIYAYHTKSTNYDFLMLRYIEDGGYCAYARNATTEILPEGNTYFDISINEKDILASITQYLNNYINTYLSSVADNIQNLSIYSPWKRMFEIGINVSYQKLN